MKSKLGPLDHTPRALELANARAERWRLRCSRLYKVNKKMDARLERVEKLLADADREAKKSQQRSYVSTKQVREALSDQ